MVLLAELIAKNGTSTGASELAEELKITANSAYRILCEVVKNLELVRIVRPIRWKNIIQYKGFLYRIKKS